jgi:hypothetical protein
MASPADPTDATARTSGWRSLHVHTRRAIVGGLVLTVLLVAGFVIVDRWRHPEAFGPISGFGVGFKDVHPGRTVYVGVMFEDQDATGTAHLHHISANVVSDSADTDIGFVMCTIVPGNSAFGAARQADLESGCSSLEPVEDADMELNGDPRQQVLMSLTPHRSGKVRVRGVDVSYRDGWQDGTQTTGGDVEVTTKP